MGATDIPKIPTLADLERLEAIRQRAQDDHDLARVSVERAKANQRQRWEEFAAASANVNEAGRRFAEHQRQESSDA